MALTTTNWASSRICIRAAHPGGTTGAEHPDDEGYSGARGHRLPPQNTEYMTEAGYLRLPTTRVGATSGERQASNAGRWSCPWPRSGDSITSCVVAYDVQVLLKQPQKVYGSSQSNVIQLIQPTDRAGRTAVPRSLGPLHEVRLLQALRGQRHPVLRDVPDPVRH